MEAARELFRHLVRHMSEPLLGVSPDGEVLLSCPAASRLLGTGNADVSGRPLAELTSDRAERILDYLRLCSRSLVPLPGALNMKSAGGQVVPCRCKGALLMPPSAAPPIVLLRLVPREGAQSPFALLNQQIAALTQEVRIRKRAEAEALRSVRLRDEFVAVAGHEFKTPLHALQLQLDFLKRSVEGLEPPAPQRLGSKLETAQRQLDRLSALSTRLLDLSTVRAGRLSLNIEPHLLAPLVRSTIVELSSTLTLACCEVAVELEPELEVLVDAARLAQVLTNLLTNAAKYAAGRPIVVRSRATAGAIQVSVKDGGMGIPAADLSRIFEKFERAVSAEHYSGLGLGLFISRQLAEAMGGSITVESEVGSGTTFIVTLRQVQRGDGAAAN